MKTKLMTIAAAVIAGSAANAATISFNATKGVVEGSSSGENILSLQKFDTMGGTRVLTNVAMTVTLSVPTYSMRVDNDSTTSANVTVVFGTLGSVGFSSSSSTYNGLNTLSGSNFSVGVQTSPDTDVAANNSDASDAFNYDSGPDNYQFSTTAVLVGQTTNRMIDSAVWSQWTGVGNVNLDLVVDLVNTLNLNSGGEAGFVRFDGVIPSATFASEVTYTYNVVPEPSAVVLGGIGMLFLLRRRNR